MLDTLDESVRHERDGARGRYALAVDGSEAELTYRLREGVMVIEHSFTPPDLRGQGLAGRLTARAARDARMEGLKISPVCAFAAAWFKEHPEERDLLA